MERERGRERERVSFVFECVLKYEYMCVSVCVSGRTIERESKSD